MKRLLTSMTAGLLSVLLASSVAVAAPKVASGLWSVYSFNAAGTDYVATKPATTPKGTGFTFLSTPDNALLATGKDKSLLGDLTGRTLTATFTINASADAALTYYGAPGACGLVGPSVRLYFEGNPAVPFTYDTAGYTKYWWSNPISATLASVIGNSVTLTVPLTTANWSDWGGELAAAVPTYFASAVASATMVGLSFGGGCFFANGVGTPTGTASFVLTSFGVN